MKHCLVWILFLGAAFPLSAQKFSFSTNLLDWTNLGTLNLQAGISASRHLTLHAGVRYNPWQFGSPDKGNLFQNKARTVSTGVRYWPWNVYSSWWFGAQLQGEEYNRGGWIFNRVTPLKERVTEEGRAYGIGLSGGYQYMLSKYFNLDFGIGLWGGWHTYTWYACPRCGRIIQMKDPDADGTMYPVKDRTGWFVLPSPQVQVSIAYVF